MRRSLRWAAGGAGVVALSLGLLTAGALGGSPARTPQQPGATDSSPSPRDPLDRTIAAAQAALTARPGDAPTWAALGLAYVQKAKLSSDPSFYVKAEGAVARSLQLDARTNPDGYAGQAALENARHDFRGAAASARKGIAINAYSSTLYGALGDALTQTGQYALAAAAIDRMNTLKPGVPAFTRASYVFELRGDLKGARTALERAVTDAVSPSDVAFVQYYLGELALHNGGVSGADTALEHYQAGLQASPGDMTVRAGRAKALAAVGQTDLALREYRAVVAAVPQPQFVLELAELEQSLGNPDARRQYDLFRTEERLYQASGVALDTEQTLFEADHGSPATALVDAAKGWRVRPFVEMADAYAWAEHVNGHDRAALGWSQRSFASGWKPALHLFHRGMIEASLSQRAAARADLAAALAKDPHFNVLQVPVARRMLASLS